MLRLEWPAAADTSTLNVTTIETPGLGDRSYVADADGWAVAVDVQRDLDRIEDVLQRRGARLGAVLETHIHNDYLSGGWALARRYGARYVVPTYAPVSFRAESADPREPIDIGPLRLRPIPAPGHTDTHTAYSLHVEDRPADAAFTGGSLLLGGTGRTDLLGPERAEELAREQYWTVRRLARLLPGSARLLPTHGFGSFCMAGRAVEEGGETLADQLTVNPAYLLNEDAFVADLLRRSGPVPAYFAEMGERNLAGTVAADLGTPPRLTAAKVQQMAAAGCWVLDVRPRSDYAKAHLPGSVSIDARGPIATWAGWTVPLDEPVVLVAADEQQLAAAQRELSRIGVDHVAGAHVGPLRTAAATLTTEDFGGLAEALGAGRSVDVLDVRETSEWHTGHVRGARHVPAHELDDLTAVVTGSAEPSWLYCASGFRATVAGTLLSRQGIDVVVLDDDVALAAAVGVPWCAGQHCPADRCVHTQT